MNSLNSQKGFLAIVAVFLILVVGFIGTMIAYMLFDSTNATNNFTQGDVALYIAEAGFEETARLLLTPNLTGSNPRVACASLTNNSNITNTSFGKGTFTATQTTGSPYYVNTTLSSAITSTVTTIPVASTTGFAPAGRLMIDREVINYGAISGNSFIGVQRGAGESYNTPHASGAHVSQYECDIDVQSGIPNLTSSLYQREIQQSMQLQEAWTVGNSSGLNFTFSRWNRPTELAWTNTTLSNSSATNLNGVSMLSNAEGWAVGNTPLLTFIILHYVGSTWSLATAPSACAGENLTSVSAVYSNEAWAVGDDTQNGLCLAGGNRRYTVLKWNGSTWTELTSATTPSIPAASAGSKTLNAVHVIDATHSGAGTIGFAVGAGGIILKYNGTSWTAMTSPTTLALSSVFVVSANEAWAVGAGGVIIKYNGTSWSTVSSPTTTQLNSISMLDSNLNGTADQGWAVGNNGVAITYNGTSWSSANSANTNNLLGVAMFYATPDQDVWAVGATGVIEHYNGSAWSVVAVNTTPQINAIAVVSPQPFPFAWQEVYS